VLLNVQQGGQIDFNQTFTHARAEDFEIDANFGQCVYGGFKGLAFLDVGVDDLYHHFAHGTFFGAEINAVLQRPTCRFINLT
jgi:hypothetical protein